MLGSLAKYLRFMGYDTKSADMLISGDRREDSVLLEMAKSEARILLTRDRELFQRGKEISFHLKSDDVSCQVKELLLAGLISSSFKPGLERCILCNTKLRPAETDEIKSSSYAPQGRDKDEFMWCPLCRRLYWAGTHSENMEKRLRKIFPGYENI